MANAAIHSAIWADASGELLQITTFNAKITTVDVPKPRQLAEFWHANREGDRNWRRSRSE